MASNKFQFIKPENWRVIKPEKYKDFSILSTELVPCVYGFAIEREQGYDVVSMFDYGESSSEFIKELNDELIKLEKNNQDVSEINDYIKENASDYVITETTSMKPIFHKTAKMFGKNCFINIMEIRTNIGKSYSLQIFVKLDRNLVCFGTSVSKIEIGNPFESIVTKNKFVDDLINILIKSLEEVKK
jgi:hypothetical protein